MTKAVNFLWTVLWSSALIAAMISVVVLAFFAGLSFLFWTLPDFTDINWALPRFYALVSVAAGIAFTCDKTGGRKYWA